MPKYVARVADDKSNISSYDSKTDTIIVGRDKLNANNALIEEDKDGVLIPTSIYITIKDGNNYKLYREAISEDGDYTGFLTFKKS